MNRFRTVSSLLGLILCAASVVKYVTLAEASLSPDLINFDWLVVLLGTGIEAALGLWLVSGLLPLSARVFAIITFSIFAFVAFVRGVRGEVSCGCLGSIEVNPWVMLVFDVIALAMLLSVKPRQMPGRRSRGADLFGLAGILCLGVGFAAHGYVTATSISRGLVLSEEVKHLGVVGQAEEHTHTFTIFNNCTFAVEIAQSQVTCGCTTLPDLRGRIVLPGQTLDVPITLRTGNSDEVVAGTVNLYCRRAGSKAPPTLHRRVRISAEVDPDFWVRPMRTDFGRVGGGPITRRQVRVRPNRVGAIKFEDFKSSHPAFEARALKELTADGDSLLEITFDPSKLSRSEAIEAVITMKTGTPASRETRLLARVDYISPLTVSPSAIVIGSDVRGEGSDISYGGNGNDTLDESNSGGDGDLLYGGPGMDTLDGGDGNDVLYGGEGSDISYGGNGNDTLDESNSGGDGNLLYGGSGDDSVSGGAGNDGLYGDAGNDTLFGYAGNDTMAGGDGNDGLYGGNGKDILAGGNGADRFLVEAGWSPSPPVDTVTDGSTADAVITFRGGWTQTEIMQVDVGLAKLHARTGNTRLLKLSPQSSWPITSGLPLTFERWGVLSKDGRPNPAILGDNDSSGLIRIADRAFTTDQSTTPVWATVIHEIGHNWDTAGENPSFNFRYFSSRPGFVSTYAQTGSKEDFAETLAATFLSTDRYHPEWAPAKVAYMNVWLDSKRG